MTIYAGGSPAGGGSSFSGRGSGDSLLWVAGAEVHSLLAAIEGNALPSWMTLNEQNVTHSVVDGLWSITHDLSSENTVSFAYLDLEISSLLLGLDILFWTTIQRPSTGSTRYCYTLAGLRDAANASYLCHARAVNDGSPSIQHKHRTGTLAAYPSNIEPGSWIRFFVGPSVARAHYKTNESAGLTRFNPPNGFYDWSSAEKEDPTRSEATNWFRFGSFCEGEDPVSVDIRLYAKALGASQPCYLDLD